MWSPRDNAEAHTIIVINIAYPTMLSVFYVTPTTSRSETLLLTLPPNLGLVSI